MCGYNIVKLSFVFKNSLVPSLYTLVYYYQFVILNKFDVMSVYRNVVLESFFKKISIFKYFASMSLSSILSECSYWYLLYRTWFLIVTFSYCISTIWYPYVRMGLFNFCFYYVIFYMLCVYVMKYSCISV